VKNVGASVSRPNSSANAGPVKKIIEASAAAAEVFKTLDTILCSFIVSGTTLSLATDGTPIVLTRGVNANPDVDEPKNMSIEAIVVIRF
jgi:hypothetical protein